jgi:membrane-bound lytic murein transglycosylase D
MIFTDRNWRLCLAALAMALTGCAQHPPRADLGTAPPPAGVSAGADKAPTPPATPANVAPGPLYPERDPDEQVMDQWLESEEALADSDDDADSAADKADADDDATAGDDDQDGGADIWARIRLGFGLPDDSNERIEREAAWFGRHQAYLDRVAERAQPYLHYIVNQVQQRGMPSEIALLPVVESAFQPYAYSSDRAAGIWQFIPGTGRRYGLKLNWWYDGRRDIVASTRAALDYLQYLHDTFDGDWLLALAAYNSGEGTVEKAIRYNKRHHRPTDFWSLRLPKETEQYVPRLLALREIVADPQQQGISLRSIPDEPYLTAVRIDSQLDLATAAKLAEMDLDELHRLNPGFNRWATGPDGPHRLLLPLDKAPIFATNVAALAPEDRVHWIRHRVRGGETLSGIAVRYHTTVKVLASLNKIRGHLIRKGQHLIIPISGSSDPALRAVHHVPVPREVAEAEEKTMHVVAAGDSLWSLAQRYGTTVRKLCRWNGLSAHKMLRPGQKLIVALNAAPENQDDDGIIPASLKLGAPEALTKPRKITYTVRKGDSLSRISQRFRVTVKQVRKWNDIKKNEYIQPGQELTLYVALTADSDRS